MAKSPGRNQGLYFTLVGVVIGLLVAGLVVPLGFGTRQVEDFVAFDDVQGDATRTEDGPDPDDFAAGGAPGSDGVGAAVAPGDGETAPGDPGATAPGEPGPRAPADQGGPAAPGGDRPAPDSQPGRTTPTTELRATDRGVTADTVRLGITLFDLGGASAVGFTIPGADPEEQREGWDAWVADLNQRGGIHGRQVEPFYYRYDVLDEDSMRAVCLRATQDDEVFAVLDIGSLQESAMCFTQENGTPLITQGGPGFTDRHYQRSGGMLFSVLPGGRRGMANFAWELHQLGELRQSDAMGQQENKPVGILSTAQPGNRRTLQEGVVDTLEGLGYEVAHWAELSEDMSVAAAQIPGAVNQMRANDVAAVLLLTSVFQSTQFVQYAETQQYRPSYYASDWAGMFSQTSASNMPDNFNGILITTSRTGEMEAGFPDPPLAVECTAVFREQAGRDDSEDETISRWIRRNTCQTFRVFERGADAAGPELTRPGFSQGLQSVGEVPLAVHGGGSLRPGKFDIADLVRTAAFDADCSCWLPVDDFRRARW